MSFTVAKSELGLSVCVTLRSGCGMQASCGCEIDGETSFASKVHDAQSSLRLRNVASRGALNPRSSLHGVFLRAFLALIEACTKRILRREVAALSRIADLSKRSFRHAPLLDRRPLRCHVAQRAAARRHGRLVPPRLALGLVPRPVAALAARAAVPHALAAGAAADARGLGIPGEKIDWEGSVTRLVRELPLDQAELKRTADRAYMRFEKLRAALG